MMMEHLDPRESGREELAAPRAQDPMIDREVPLDSATLSPALHAWLDGEPVNEQELKADGKKVIVIGGGDTGSDCVGTSTRHGAKSVTQFEVMPMPPEQENKPLVWPYWPLKLRTSSSHDESQGKGLLKREFAISTKEFLGKNGKLTGLKTVHVEMKDGKLSEVPGTEQEWPADMVLLALAGDFVPFAVNVEATEANESLRPFLPLAETLGRLFGSLVGATPDSLEVCVEGDIASLTRQGWNPEEN